MNNKVRTIEARKRNCGHTLMVALVFLLATGMLSATLLNATMEIEKVARNGYAQIKAEFAAATALRYCESILEDGIFGELKASSATSTEYGSQWLRQENWMEAFPGYRKVPSSWIDVRHIQANKNIPECLIEIAEPNLEKSFLITARGYSEDFQLDVRGKPKTGARVWLQERVKFL